MSLPIGGLCPLLQVFDMPTSVRLTSTRVTSAAASNANRATSAAVRKVRIMRRSIVFSALE